MKVKCTSLPGAVPVAHATAELEIFCEKPGPLAKGDRAAGEHFVFFDAADLDSGICVYRLNTNTEIE